MQAEEFHKNPELVKPEKTGEKSQDRHPFSPLQLKVDSVCGGLFIKTIVITYKCNRDEHVKNNYKAKGKEVIKSKASKSYLLLHN